MKAKTVLVAEDDPGLRALLKEVLEGGGYHVALCEDGAVAWQRLQKGGVDLAVLDVNMPNMNGIELCRRIRSHPEAKSLPVLMLTIRALVEDQVAGFEGGADDYLTKPFNAEILLSRLKVLERRILNRLP
jgi:DNA-binding response OmpR family regulator